MTDTPPATEKGVAPGVLPSLRRRTMLATAAAAGVSAASSPPDAKSNIMYLRLLDFDLTPDGSAIVITEKQQKVTRPPAENGKPAPTDKNEGPPLLKANWIVPVRAFGPRATFDMEPPAERRGTPVLRRVIIIRTVSYDGEHFFPIRFVFERREEIDPWTMSFGGTPWQGPASSGSVLLEEFVRSPDAGLVGIAEIGGAGPLLASILVERVRLDAPKGTRLEVRLDRDCAFRFDVTGGGAFTAFGGAVRMTQLVLRWALESQSGKTPRWTVVGTGQMPTVATLRLGEASGHHLALSDAGTQDAIVDIRVAPSPLRPSVQQVVVCLSLAAVTLDVFVGARKLVGPLPLDSVAVTDTVLPNGAAVFGRIVRQTLSGDSKSQPLLETPIGRLTVGVPDLERPTDPKGVPDAVAATAADVQTYVPSLAPASAASRLFVAAGGDKGGVRDATVFAVHDAGAGAKRGLRRIDVALGLLGADVALEDASDSRLAFKDADLRIHFEDGHALFPDQRREYPRQLASSWVWAGPINRASGLSRGALDLSRATLCVRRAEDLVDLVFRFHDLVLSFNPTPLIRPAREDCRVIARTDTVLVDNRPLLLVEFSPQHVMEEAVFRPMPPPLPDAKSKETQQAIEAKLDGLRGPESTTKRLAFRQAISEEKKAEDSDTGRQFKAFAEKFATLKIVISLPTDMRDQAVYIGPFGLDPDLLGAARALFMKEGEKTVNETIAKVLKRVDELAGPASPIGSRLHPLTDPDAATAWTHALANEAMFEQLYPLYGLFRDLWRDTVVLGRVPAGSTVPEGLPDLSKYSTQSIASEFLAPGNRPEQYPIKPDTAFAAIDRATHARMLAVALGQEKPRDVMGARLSGRSRLAFRINCTPLTGLDAAEAGVSRTSVDSPAHPGAGSAAYDPIQFTLAALTDWSRHEPEVTRRARKLFKPLNSGVLPPLGLRAAEASDHAMLEAQGIRPGLGSVERRMTAIRATLVRPTEFETAIELPSRLVLSTAQDAIWLTSRRLSVDLPKPTRQRQQPIWSARLSVADMSPGVRAVWSPDLRTMALGGRVDGGPGGVPLPGHAAPPRGPWAPWLIGPEQSDSGVFDAVAAEAAAKSGDGKPRRPIDVLLTWLQSRRMARDETPTGNGYRLFRTSLDAWDRHNLVLQSSAYGLPVVGAREELAGGGAGGLIRNSGMFEPGETYRLFDTQDGDAVYRPVPLDVREMTLTALGGSLLHDTSFVPASGAPMLRGGMSFDGFSIQRWQHEVVLGRDVRVEVIYKGYLMPFSHRAALVKLTERTFLRTPTEGIKAVLRQRMFLRVKPVLNFPLTGQAHFGRLMCGRTVALTAERTPDLLDPTTAGDGKVDESVQNGRVYLEGNPGLVFWPRTSLTPAGLLQFECTIDGVPTRAPMLFLDKIAATNQASLEAAAKHYNDLSIVDRRKLPINGRKLRYAPETVPGDTSLVTKSILLRVHGRLYEDAEKWTGKLSDFQNSPVLEGADQPPFYPAMETAEVRLEQIERLTGAPTKTTVQYDGHYIRHGFGTKDALPGTPSRTSDGQNEMGVFLDLKETVLLDMGSNGDRSGGIGRPNGKVVAISRSKGPLSKDDGMVASHDGKGTPANSLTDFDSGLGSLAWWFHVQPEAPAVAAGLPGSAGSSAPLATGTSPRRNQKDLLKSLFDPSARLLGVITLGKLMEWVAAATKLPELKEAVDYGTKALGQVTDKLNTVMAEVRRVVLLPLRDVVQRLQFAWNSLDLELKKTSIEGRKPLTVAVLFPEVDAALRNLGQALDEALAASDPLALGDALGEVFASGRRMAHEIEVLAAHPVQRLQEAVEHALDQQTGAVADAVNTLRNAMDRGLRSWVQSLDYTSIDTLLTNLGVNDDDLVDALLLTDVPLPQLVATLKAMVLTGAFNKSREAVDKAQRKLPLALKASAQGSVRELVQTVFRDVMKGDPFDPRTILPNFEAKVVAEIEAVRTALHEDLEGAQEGLPELVKTTLLGILQRAADAMKAGAVIDRVQPEIAAALEGLDRVRRLAEALRQLQRSATRGDIPAMIGQVAALARVIFGVDAKTVLDGLGNTVLKPAIKEVQSIANKYPIRAPDPASLTFAADLSACLEDKLPPTVSGKPTGSTPLLRAIAEGIAGVGELKTQWALIASELGKIDNALIKKKLEDASSPVTVDQIKNFLRDGDALCAALRLRLSAMFRDVVRGTAIMGALTENSASTGLDGLRDMTALLGTLRAAGADAARHAQACVELLGNFVKQNAALLGVGLPIAVVAPALGRRAQLAIDAEHSFTIALANALDLVLGAARVGGLAADKELDDLSSAVAAAAKAAKDQGLSLEPEATDLTNELSALTMLNGRLVNLKLPTPPPDTLAGLLASEVSPGVVIRLLFQAPVAGQPTPFAGELAELQTAEAAALRLMLALGHRLKSMVEGLPQRIQTNIETKFHDSGFVRNLGEAAKKATDARGALVEAIENDAILGGNAKLLLVKPTAIYDPDNSDKTYDKASDRLAQELKVLLAQKDRTKLDPRLIAYFASWGDGTAAPLQIVAQVSQMVSQIAQGKILAALDLSSFRDAIENALSSLVPTQATLRYDFNTVIDTEPKADSIFQPALGAAFGIEVRGVVDLLHPERTRFGAKAHLGPFDILLIGGVVDALTLSFGGLSFEASTGAKPRFDVAYRSFTIGPALEFAKQLEPFLSPGDDNGPYVRPLRTGLGLEAGFAIDLGTIGIGVTSFFNVKLGLSAELPFDDHAALFKVSLGLPMAPFTMSVVPFAGSGYFAILANGSGPIGFEASFEFGMGGAVGFGPLQVMARVQVGLYLRLELLGGKMLTTVSGTFFAGGSASIWIFSFTTVLYVRLGQQPGGSMQGEAIFTFSFSLGLVDYDYSVTLLHTEEPVGKRQESSLNEGWIRYAQNAGPEGSGPVWQPVLSGPAVMTDAPAPAAFAAPASAGTTGPPPRHAKRREPPLVHDQMDDWARYAQYFDTAGLPECHFKGAHL